MIKKFIVSSLALALMAVPALAQGHHGGAGFHGGGGGGFHGRPGGGVVGGYAGRGYGGGYGRGRGYGAAPYIYGGLAAGALLGGGYLYNRYEDGYYGYPSSLQGGTYDDQCSVSDLYRAPNGRLYHCE